MITVRRGNCTTTCIPVLLIEQRHRKAFNRNVECSVAVTYKLKVENAGQITAHSLFVSATMKYINFNFVLLQKINKKARTARLSLETRDTLLSNECLLQYAIGRKNPVKDLISLQGRQSVLRSLWPLPSDPVVHVWQAYWQTDYLRKVRKFPM